MSDYAVHDEEEEKGNIVMIRYPFTAGCINQLAWQVF